MGWGWKRTARIDRRTCEECFRRDGETASTQAELGPIPQHIRCRCILLLAWLGLGGRVYTAASIAPKELLAAEDTTRAWVAEAIRKARTREAVRSGVYGALLLSRLWARYAGRKALAAEVDKLRPKLNSAPLLRRMVRAEDKRKAMRAARGVASYWWLVMAAIVAERQHTKAQARKEAAARATARAEASVVHETSEAFSDERLRAEPELLRLKTRKGES